MTYEELRPIADAAAQAHMAGVLAASLKLLVLWWLESRWDAGAVNPYSGATGLGQVIPSGYSASFAYRPTSEELLNAEVNADWSARILQENLARAAELHPAWSSTEQLRLALKWYSGGWERSGDEVYEQVYWRHFEKQLVELMKGADAKTTRNRSASDE